MEFQMLHCWQEGCPRTFYTFTDLSNHHLAMHEVPLKAGPVVPWTPKVRVTPWQPVLRGTLTGVMLAPNGAMPPGQSPATEPTP